MWRLQILEYGRSWGGTEMAPKIYNETIEFPSLQEVRCWFSVLSERDADARPHIRAKLYDGERLMFEISREKQSRQYRWEFVPA